MKQETITCQGREVSIDELNWLRDIIEANKGWSRKRISKELCKQWQWQTASGQQKTFAAREFLIKLENRGLIKLPELRVNCIRNNWSKPVVEQLKMPEPENINCPLFRAATA